MTEEKKETEQTTPVDLMSLELNQVIGLFIGILSSKAWQYMGLRLKPGKNEVEKDLVKAAATIDIINYLTEKLAPSLPQNEAHKLKNLVVDLQINYAKMV